MGLYKDIGNSFRESFEMNLFFFFLPLLAFDGWEKRGISSGHHQMAPDGLCKSIFAHYLSELPHNFCAGSRGRHETPQTRARARVNSMDEVSMSFDAKILWRLGKLNVLLDNFCRFQSWMHAGNGISRSGNPVVHELWGNVEKCIFLKNWKE